MMDWMKKMEQMSSRISGRISVLMQVSSLAVIFFQASLIIWANGLETLDVEPFNLALSSAKNDVTGFMVT